MHIYTRMHSRRFRVKAVGDLTPEALLRAKKLLQEEEKQQERRHEREKPSMPTSSSEELGGRRPSRDLRNRLVEEAVKAAQASAAAEREIKAGAGSELVGITGVLLVVVCSQRLVL